MYVCVYVCYIELSFTYRPSIELWATFIYIYICSPQLYRRPVCKAQLNVNLL